MERDGLSKPPGLHVAHAGTTQPAAPGLEGCDPCDYLLFGGPARGPVAPDVLAAYPLRTARGAVVPLPGERQVGAWAADRAVATRRMPGGLRVEGRRRWEGAQGPFVTVTNRRVLLRGGARDEAAHIALERLAGVRMTRRRRRGTVALDVLLHCPRTGAAGALTLEVVTGRRRAAALVRAIAEAHRERWRDCALPAATAAALDAARPRRLPRELRYDPPVHVPLGLADAIRGPRAPVGVPQRMRTTWPEARQAKAGANASASSS